MHKICTDGGEGETSRKKAKRSPGCDGDRRTDDVTSTENTENDSIICEEIVLKRPPLIVGNRSPQRDNQNTLPNEGWKTAPAKLVNKTPTPDDYSEAHPLNFMKTDNWPPAKRRRLKNEFFE